MDTAQRGMGLGWDRALDLIRRSVAEAATVPGAVVFSGVGTDHLPPSPDLDLDAIRDAYLEQLDAVQAAGGRVILMASRALAAAATAATVCTPVCTPVCTLVHTPAPMTMPGSTPGAGPGRPAGDHPLAGRHVRPGAEGLLGR